MNPLRPESDRWRVAVPRALVAAVLLSLTMAGRPARAQLLPADSGWRDVSLAEYRQHLENLESVVSDCTAQRNLKAPPPASDHACDPNRVGPDDRVSGAVLGDSLPREVRYDWLRTVLASAGGKAAPAQSGFIRLKPETKTPAPNVDVLLAEARSRLQVDEKQAANPTETAPGYAAERQKLSSILADPAYRSANEVSAGERFREWFYNQLDKFLASLVRFGTRLPGIVWTLRILLLLGISVGLVWALVRIERRSRVKLIPDVEPSPGAPSAREWQLWLKDAQAMAAKGEWRDAIHFVYWASIARLESRRLWPADRARTPREYLGLLPVADPRKPSLTALTRSFERTWYGGRKAESADFHAALEQAETLGVTCE
jgi:hypothetical protein